ncbi:putative ribonuclease H-like domain-containing protein [Tanacetum coccineum]
MIAIRIKKFYKKIERRVLVDGKTPVGFDKKKLECFNCHNTGHFAREYTAKATHDGKKKRDSFYQHQEAGKQEKNQTGLLTMDDDIINWGEHTEDEETNHALIAISSSSDVSLCSKTCIDSYNTLKTLCDEPNESVRRGLRSIGTSSEHSVDPELEISRVPLEVSRQPVPIRTSNSFSPKRPQVNQFNQRRHFSKSYSSVRRPFAKTTAQMSHSHAVKGNWGSAVKIEQVVYWRTLNPKLHFGTVDQILLEPCAMGLKDHTNERNMGIHGGSVTFEVSNGYLSVKKKIRRCLHLMNLNCGTEGTSQNFISDASEEKDEDVELIVVPSAVKHTEEKVESRTSSTNSKQEVILTEPQQEKKASSTDTSEDNPKILAFRRELEEIALKHLGTVSENNSTSTPSVNTGSESVNTGRFDPDDSPMPVYGILVDLPHGMKVIGIKWLYRNKRDERGVVVRNKARLVVQGYTQEEGIDYDEVFAPVARIEAIRLFLAFASFMGFIVYQMDVKSAFLYGNIDEEVYVSQPPRNFVDHGSPPKKVIKRVKALFTGLHQAPRAWYATLSTFLEKHGYKRGTIDKTLFIKRDKKDIMLVSSGSKAGIDIRMRKLVDVDVHYTKSIDRSLPRLLTSYALFKGNL